MVDSTKTNNSIYGSSVHIPTFQFLHVNFDNTVEGEIHVGLDYFYTMEVEDDSDNSFQDVLMTDRTLPCSYHTQFNCPYCNKVFINRRRFFTHMKTYHSNRNIIFQ